jgi:SRSO17 transposase
MKKKKNNRQKVEMVMDVELQIIKHLARDAQPTVAVIDEYCSSYKDLFPEVRSYECFKYLHLGIISPIKRKSLPEIAKIVGINSAQSLHHFISKSPWSIVEMRREHPTCAVSKNT